ncbi:MAG: enoyl-CoA hydratase [Rhizobiaceae bacterium]|nr:enoyl-CoA hydratase [Rhizobiaceae bacterium]
MTSLVLTNLDSGVLHLTMNSPQNRNALSVEMVSALCNVFRDAKNNKQVRVIVLAANGSAFCAGHDLKQMADARAHEDGGNAYFHEVMGDSAKLMQAIVNHPRPVIADVRGVASAAGCQLVASCDLAIASENSRFATPGVNIGLFCSTPMVALSRNISHKHAMEMLLTGDMISAHRAEQIGLINQVVAENKIDRAVNLMAEKIASKSMMTIETGKSAFYTQAQMDLGEAYRYTVDVMAENMMKNDACEGTTAFVEKRKPKWTDS